MRTASRVLVALIALAAGSLVVAASSGPARAQDQTVAVGDIWFCNAQFENGICDTTVTAGDTVTWDFSAGTLAHTTTGPFWDSGFITDGSTFSVTFDSAGTFAYTCTVHPSQMNGRIIVQEAQQPEPTQPATDQPVSDQPGDATPVDAPTSAPAGDDEAASGVPTTGFGPQERSSSWWLTAVLAAAGVSLTALGAAAYRGGARD
jgi:plastocyanin